MDLFHMPQSVNELIIILNGINIIALNGIFEKTFGIHNLLDVISIIMMSLWICYYKAKINLLGAKKVRDTLLEQEKEEKQEKEENKMNKSSVKTNDQTTSNDTNVNNKDRLSVLEYVQKEFEDWRDNKTNK